MAGARLWRASLALLRRVRGAGFALLATFDAPHFTLVLPDVSELTLARLERCFDLLIPNPGRPLRGSLACTEEALPWMMPTTSPSTSWT